MWHDQNKTNNKDLVPFSCGNPKTRWVLSDGLIKQTEIPSDEHKTTNCHCEEYDLVNHWEESQGGQWGYFCPYPGAGPGRSRASELICYWARPTIKPAVCIKLQNFFFFKVKKNKTKPWSALPLFFFFGLQRIATCEVAIQLYCQNYWNIIPPNWIFVPIPITYFDLHLKIFVWIKSLNNGSNEHN